MDETVQEYEMQVIRLRKQLAEVESRQGKYSSGIPGDILQELASISWQLERAEQKVSGIYRGIIAEVNEERLSIIKMLDEFMNIRQRMREIEDQFMANIVRPGFHLKRAIQHREFLDNEYRRMFTKILHEGYADLVDLEKEIRRVLSTGENEEASTGETEEEEISDDTSKKIYDISDMDEFLNLISKEELIKEFKRVVLPAVHPDTSTTPVETFKTIYEVYEKGDVLLMEGYIIQYRGNIAAEKDTDPLENLDKARELLKQYRHTSTRIQHRLRRLQGESTKQELEHPEILQENMLKQRNEILRRIQHESEMILLLRGKIEGLTREYRDRHASQEGAE